MTKPQHLTEQDINVLREIKANPKMSNRDIADFLIISPLSVGNVMNDLYARVGIEGGKGTRKRPILNAMLAKGEII